MTDLTETIRELKKLSKGATPGPWEDASRMLSPDMCGNHGIDCCVRADTRSRVAFCGPGRSLSDPEPIANALLIAAMRNALPDFLEAVEQRDHHMKVQEATRNRWAQAAKKALDGNTTDLWLLVKDWEAPPMNVTMSDILEQDSILQKLEGKPDA